MRWMLAITLGIVAGLPPVWCQQANEDAIIDGILAQKSITFGNAAWLVGRSIGTFDESIAPEQAAAKAVAAGWGSQSLGAADPLDLKAFSQVLVQAFHVPGGLLYSWFPGPRYALRELVFRKIIPSTLAPDQPLSGEEAMRYLQATQDWKDGVQ